MNRNVNQKQTPENYVKNSRKKSRSKEREITLNLRDYKEFSTLYHKFNSLGFHPPLVGRGLFVLNCKPESGWNASEISLTATIFVCGVVTAAIVDA